MSETALILIRIGVPLTLIIAGLSLPLMLIGSLRTLRYVGFTACGATLATGACITAFSVRAQDALGGSDGKEVLFVGTLLSVAMASAPLLCTLLHGRRLKRETRNVQ
ncbi:MAG: hypothetical protein AAGI37_11985 [Planctomycetota bacterium]